MNSLLPHILTEGNKKMNGYSLHKFVDKTYEITYVYFIMTALTVSQARSSLYKLLDQVARMGEPILITGKRHNGYLISEDDWRSIQETLYLLSIPGMRASIRKGLKTPINKCDSKLKW